MRMSGKLAFRNVKRQMGNYLIYYITVSLTIALMFAFNSVVTSPDLAEKARSFSDIAGGLVMISVMMALIVAFVLGYASSFLLKLRKREFGTYLTMGMTRFDMILLFTMETLIIGLIPCNRDPGRHFPLSGAYVSLEQSHGDFLLIFVLLTVWIPYDCRACPARLSSVIRDVCTVPLSSVHL